MTSRRKRFVSLAVAGALVATGVLVAEVATPFTVAAATPIANPVTTSAELTYAVANVTAGATINVAPGTYALAAPLSITKVNTSIAAVEPGTVVFAFTGTSGRVVDVKASGTKIDGVTITGGKLTTAGGAGILVARNTSLDLTRSTVTGNTAREGGGIANLGTLSVKQSTIFGNTADRKGGGLLNQGTATVENSTFVDNVAAQGGAVSSPGVTDITHATIVRNKSTSSSSAGVDRNGGTLRIYYSIIGSNVRTNGAAAADCSGTPELLGLNHVSDSSGCNPIGEVKVAPPNVGDLRDNGGPTFTVALLDGSAALDAKLANGSCSGSTLAVDQRGAARPNGVCRDLGAYERAPLGVDLELTVDTSNYAPLPAGTVEVGLVSLPVDDIAGELASSSGSLADAGLRSIALRSIGLRSITIEDLGLRSIEPRAAELRSIALRSIGLRSIALRSIGLRSIELQSIGLRSIPLSEIPLLDEGGWETFLAGTDFVGVPLQSITLEQLELADDATLEARLGTLSLESIDLSHTALRSIALRSIVLADVALRSIPVDGYEPDAHGSYVTAWCELLGDLCGPDADQMTPAEIGDADLLTIQLAGGNVDSVDISAVPLAGLASLESTGLRSIGLRSIALRSIYLENTALRSIGLRSIALRSIGLRSIVACDGVTDPYCEQSESNTLTLADAIAAGKIRADATVGDLIDLACRPEEQSCIDLFAGLSLLDLLLAFVAPEVAPWEQIDLENALLQNIGEPPQPTFDYVATVTVSDAVADLDIGVLLPAGFVVATRDGETSSFDGQPVQRAATGLGSAEFTLASVAPGVHVLRIPVRAGVETGTGVRFTAFADVVATAPGEQPASAQDDVAVDVVAAAVGDGSRNATASLSFGDLRLAHIDSGDDVDLYTFEAPADADGATVRILLSNIPAGADYDLAIYSPSSDSLRGTPTRTLASLGDVRYDLDPTDDALPADIVDDVAVDVPGDFGKPGYSLRGISSRRSSDDEEVVLTAIEGGVTYYVAVTSYLDDFSNMPYGLRLRVDRAATMPACRAGDRTFPFALPAAGVSTIPSGANTLYVTNTQWLTGEFGEAAARDVLAAALATGGSVVDDTLTGVVPAVLAVDSYPAVRTAYAEWAKEANRCDPEARNDVVRAIGVALDDVLASSPGIEYIVLVGGDGVVPMAAVPDRTAYSNESTFARDVLTDNRTNELSGALGAGYLLSDDPYSTARGIAIQGSGHELYAPDLNLGRLVETAEQIVAQLTNFTKAAGRLDPGTLPLSSTVTGYDFLTDGAQQVAAELELQTVSAPLSPGSEPLIGDRWDRTDYLDAFEGGGADVISPNAHYDFESLLPAAADAAGSFSDADLVTTADFVEVPSRLPEDSLIFTMGCHAGLSVSDVQLGLTGALDWAQLYADGDNQWLAHTTYGYGDTEIVAFSERLTAIFAAHVSSLLAGTNGAPVSLGEAVRLAKQEYLASSLVLTPYDEKILQSFTYYGLPMYTIGDGPTGEDAPPEPTPATIGAPRAETRVGLDARPVSIELDLPGTGSSPTDLTLVETAAGAYYEVDGNTVAAQYRPIQPLVDVPIPAIPAGPSAGFLITGLTSVDRSGFEPLYLRPTVDLDTNERRIVPADGSFPAKLQRVTTDGTGAQHLLVAAGQFQGDGDDGTGRQRLYTRISGQLYQAGPGSDGVGPQFVRVDGSVGDDEDVVFFEVETDGSAERVVVVYRINQGNEWRAVDLFRPLPGRSVRIGGVPVPDGAVVEFFVQAVDADGDVSISTNKVDNFLSTVPTLDGKLEIVASGVVAGGYYRSDVVVTLEGFTAPAQYSLDGAPFQDYVEPFVVTGDGGHVILARDGFGSQLLYVVIDQSKPVITATETLDTGDGWSAGAVAVLLLAEDVGQSGVASITYSATGAGAFGPVTADGDSVSVTVEAQGVTTITAVATDVAGNVSAPVTSVVRIDTTKPTVAFTPDTSAWSATNVVVTVKGTDPAVLGEPGSGVASITYSATGAGAFGAVTADGDSVSVTVQAQGVTTITATATDLAGNVSLLGTSTVRIDATKPTVAFTPDTSAWSTTNVVVTVKGTDPAVLGEPGSGVASITYSATGAGAFGPVTTVGDSVSVPVTAEGVTTITATATDRAGNPSMLGTTTVRIDRTAPTLIAGVSPQPAAGANGYVKPPATVTLTASDGGSGVGAVRYQINGGAELTYSGPFTISSNGQHEITATATDQAGNPPTTTSATVWIDALAPTAAISIGGTDADGDGILDPTSATFSCTDPSPGSGVKSCVLKLDGQTVATSNGTESTYTFGNLAIGNHTLTVTPTDNVDNLGTVATQTIATGYRVCPLYDTTQAKNVGSNYTIKIRLCDATGTNLSSANITLTALSIDNGTAIPLPPNDSGKANAGYEFRYVASDRSYVYNLATSGIPAGSHRLFFTTGPVPNRLLLPPPTNSAPFILK